MRFRTVSSPHKYSKNSVSKVMLHVCLGLVPGTIAMSYFFGYGVLINIILAVITAWLTEAAILKIRGREVLNALKDNSALVSAWLFALAIPTLAPWWLPVIGIFFGILFGKQLYGGLGYNPFNPAMVAYVVLLISFPVEMTNWLSASSIADNTLSFMESIRVIFTGQFPNGLNWDSISGATPLDEIDVQLRLGASIQDVQATSLWGTIGGKGWEWVALAYLLGGLYLLYQRIITWHTPVALLVALAVISSVFYLIDNTTSTSPLFHLSSGGAMLGAFFIATDPVSSCTSNKGKLFFGAGIGLLIFIIRQWGGYPDGVAFAVLLMNMAAPFLDYYTKPKVFGARPGQ